jgi:hypothetical protein
MRKLVHTSTFSLHSVAKEETNMGVHTFPNLAGQSLRPELRIVRRADHIVSLNVAEVCEDNPEELYYEDKLGCARGIVYALGFQGVLLGAGMLCWRFFIH